MCPKSTSRVFQGTARQCISRPRLFSVCTTITRSSSTFTRDVPRTPRSSTCTWKNFFSSVCPGEFLLYQGRCGPHCLFDCFLTEKYSPSMTHRQAAETGAHASNQSGSHFLTFHLRKGKKRSCAVLRSSICKRHLSHRPGPGAILPISTVPQGPRHHFPRRPQNGSDFLTSLS